MTDANKSVVKSLGLKPLTKENILYYYVPLQSMVSYAALSVNVMNPSIAIRYTGYFYITFNYIINTL